jgi:tRNA 2-selenouridine synthase
MEVFIRLVLVYYDKTYANGQGKRTKESVHNLVCKSTNALENSTLLLNHIQSKQIKKAMVHT